MFLNSRKPLLAAAICFFAPALGFSTAISVNETCPVGSCTNVDVLPVDSYVQGDLNTTYTFADGDSYQITGHYGALNTSKSANPNDYGPDLNVNVTAVYLGTTPSVGHDVLTINFLQAYSLSGFTEDDMAGTYTSRTDATVLQAGAGSTFQAQQYINGVGLGVMGPFREGISEGTGGADLSNFGATTTGRFEFIYDFESGSQSGALISSLALPEPNYGLLFGVLLASAGVLRFRQQKKSA